MDLDKVRAAVIAETGDEELAARVAERLRQRPARPHRRARAVLDPFAVYAGSGLDALRVALERLEVEQLKDIVAQHGMDPNRLAMKWKSADRLIDHIIGFVESRSRKGNAFLS